MSASAGWYDDPRDPATLRYWDGVMWTDHVTPKQSPTLAQSHIGQAHPVPAVQPQASPAQPSAAAANQPFSTPTATGQPPWQQGAGEYAGAPQWQQPRSLGVVTTPDGAEISGWWKRVLARVLDSIVVSVISLPLTGWFYLQYVKVIQSWMDAMLADARAGRQTGTLMLPGQAYTYLVPAALITLVVYAAYEILFLSRTGATPGKRIVGISVRLREVAGPPPASAVLKRFTVQQGPALLALVPVVGSVLSLFQVLDSLWPLWDQRRQALHDKVAKTNVVVGPQPRRGQPAAGSGSGSAAQDRPADQLGSGSR